MPDYGRDTDIGKMKVDTVPVDVETNVDVVTSLSGVTAELNNLIEEQRKIQTALSFIQGQELDIEEG